MPGLLEDAYLIRLIKAYLHTQDQKIMMLGCVDNFGAYDRPLKSLELGDQTPENMVVFQTKDQVDELTHLGWPSKQVRFVIKGEKLEVLGQEANVQHVMSLLKYPEPPISIEPEIEKKIEITPVYS